MIITVQIYLQVFHFNDDGNSSFTTPTGTDNSPGSWQSPLCPKDRDEGEGEHFKFDYTLV